MKDIKVVIIGGVAGGATTAARLRRINQNCEIIIFERGDYISYANCGLPYHVGEVIRSRASLLLQTPEAMRERFKVDVRVKQEVISIDREKKIVQVLNHANQTTYEESYDVLVISTGSSPLKPPIPGIDSPKVMSLWTVPDTDRIIAYIRENQPRSAVVIGGGFIGLEMAENLRHRNLDVTLVELQNQVMTTLDYEMAQHVHEILEQNGVRLQLGDGVESFEEKGAQIIVRLKSGEAIKTDMVILSIGVKPNGALAKAAGLEMNSRGGIIVDHALKTNDPNIYAIGDVIEVEDAIDRAKVMIPLAGPANKQGRIVANNIIGKAEQYAGTQGSAICKVFDLTVAHTGWNEKMMVQRGLKKGVDFDAVTIAQNSHAGYYPGARPLTIKLIFDLKGKKIFGAQVVGFDGVDKRIDTLGTVIRLGGSIHDLTTLEFAYAPPYSSAKDPVNMAGFVAENLVNGLVRFAEWNVVETCDLVKTTLLDVREIAEQEAFSIPNAMSIPLGQLRERKTELDREKGIVIFCAIGVRAYNAARVLMAAGFPDVKIYPGGSRFYRSTHYKSYLEEPMKDIPVKDSGHVEESNAPAVSVRVDCSGMQCPGPIMKVFEMVKGMKTGEVLEIAASDPGFARDIEAWCRRTGNTLVMNEKRGDDYIAQVRKGSLKSVEPLVEKHHDGKTLIVFSGDLDKVLASFIIANGAAAMGRPVTMFFTFWGLNVLRRPEKIEVKKSFMESMFGMMMPRGTGKLALSKMNMGGMGTAMMKMIMKDKNVDSLEALIQKAMASGVRIVACTMSMDVMGIKQEELIDGVELGGVGAYLGDAEESDVNLFI